MTLFLQTDDILSLASGWTCSVGGRAHCLTLTDMGYIYFLKGGHTDNFGLYASELPIQVTRVPPPPPKPTC